MATKFTLTWNRLPTERELEDLVRDYVKEEVYYREAKRMDLDIDDPIIRRRLRQKLEFLAQSEAEEIRPDDATFQAWLDRNPMRYAAGTLYSFDQVFVDKADTGNSQGRARALLNRLSNGEE